MAGNLSIMTITGGTSTSCTGAATIWGADLAKTPFSVTVASVVNSTATTPNWSLLVTQDTPGGLITASSSSGTALNINSTIAFPNSSVTWFSSLAATNSSNALINITAPFRYLTLAATAGTSIQTITATIVQAG